MMLRRPVFASGDVYSFGYLMKDVASVCEHVFLTRPLYDVVKLCIFRNPRRRSSLPHVTQAITGLRDQLLPHHLNAILGCRLYGTFSSEIW